MNDKFTVRAVVLGLLVVVILSVVATVILALAGDALPDYVKYVGTTALGAFAGVLAKTGTDVQPVTVTNAPADPVPTSDVPAKKRGDKGETFVWFVLVILAACLGYLLAHAILRAV